MWNSFGSMKWLGEIEDGKKKEKKIEIRVYKVPTHLRDDEGGREEYKNRERQEV